MNSLILASLLGSLAFLPTSSAVIYESASQLPNDITFDYVIVGGGAAGSVLANRLTEGKNTVLIIEAGGHYQDALETHIPFFAARIPPTYFWNYTTVPQKELDGNNVAYPRGFILGGSSAVNGMFYTRGPREDLNRFADITGDQGWNWNNMQPYFHKHERWVAPADHHDVTGQIDPRFHINEHGPVAVSVPGFPQGIDNKVLATSKQLGGPFKFNLDVNSGDPLGLVWAQVNIEGGNRSTAATAYLPPKIVSSRKNLHVLLNTRVSRVLPTKGQTKTFRSVEYAQNLAGPFFQVSAKKEVILSAGAVGTPHILLNSGIGDSSYLREMNIPTLLNLPSVGKNLTDHPSVQNIWTVNSTDTFEQFNNKTALDAALKEWSTSGTGPLVDSASGSHIVFWRLNDTFAREFGTGASPGGDAPQLELIIINGMLSPNPPPGNFLTVVVNEVSADSRGSIRLNDVDRGVFSSPLIDPGFLTAKFDLPALREGIKTAFKFVSAPAWKNYVISPFGPLNATFTDDAIDNFIRANAGTANHVSGTASMSPKGAQWGVVDPDLRVKNAKGLRIVDVSVYPFSSSGHPIATIYSMAERAADLIKAAN